MRVQALELVPPTLPVVVQLGQVPAARRWLAELPAARILADL